MPEWIKQGSDFCCFLYALCNSARFFGASSPEPGDAEWEKLVDIIGCRYGGAISHHTPAKRMNFRLERVEIGRELLRLPGYRADAEAPVEELVNPSEIEWPRPPNDQHWVVTRASEWRGNKMAREKTMDETREELFDNIASNAVECIRKNDDVEGAVISAVFHVFTTLEGAGRFPFCVVLPHSGETDAEFDEHRGEDWYPRVDVGADQYAMKLLQGEDHHVVAEKIKKLLKQGGGEHETETRDKEESLYGG